MNFPRWRTSLFPPRRGNAALSAAIIAQSRGEGAKFWLVRLSGKVSIAGLQCSSKHYQRHLTKSWPRVRASNSATPQNFNVKVSNSRFLLESSPDLKVHLFARSANIRESGNYLSFSSRIWQGLPEIVTVWPSCVAAATAIINYASTLASFAEILLDSTWSCDWCWSCFNCTDRDY